MVSKGSAFSGVEGQSPRLALLRLTANVAATTLQQTGDHSMRAGRTGFVRGAVLAMAAGLAWGAPAGAETVRMTVSFYSAATGPYFEKMAADFHAANPGIDVKIDVVNWASLLRKLQTDTAGRAN